MPGFQTFPGLERDWRISSKFVAPATMPILSGAEQYGPFWGAKPLTSGSSVTSFRSKSRAFHLAYAAHADLCKQHGVSTGLTQIVEIRRSHFVRRVHASPFGTAFRAF